MYEQLGNSVNVNPTCLEFLVKCQLGEL